MSDTDDAAGTQPPPLPPPPAPTPADDLSRNPLGKPVSGRDTLIVILLASLADLLLYSAPGGTGAGLVLLAAAFGLSLATQRASPWPRSLLLLTVLLCAPLLVWRQWWLLHAVAWGALALGAVKRVYPQQRPPLLLFSAAWTLLGGPLRGCGHAGAVWAGIKARLPGGAARTQPRLPARVVLIPVGVCLLFVLIFAGANPVVAKLVNRVCGDLGRWLEIWLAHISFARIVVWTLWVMLFAALARPAAIAAEALGFAPRADRLTPPAIAEVAPESDGNQAAALSTLVSVCGLFVAYNLLDGVYLYGRATLPAGITWTAYTHAGCGWLTLGLGFSSVVLGFIFRDKLNFHPRAARLRFWAYAWAGLNGVIAVGALRRLQMYIDFSGLTHLRLTGLYGCVLVACGLGIMVWKVRHAYGFGWLLRRYLVAFGLGLTLLAVTPNEWLCSTYNARQVLAGKPRAMRPICQKSLGPEGLPPLIPLLEYRCPEGSDVREQLVRRGVAAILGDGLDQLERDARRDGWTQWQGSHAWALRRLRDVASRLDEIVAQKDRAGARRRLEYDYDLTGQP